MAPVMRQRQAPKLATSLSIGDGLQEMLAGALQALRRQDAVSRAQDPDIIHRFRIGIRRLRSILSAFGDVLPERERRALGDRLHAAAQRYARAREWDVFIADTIEPLRVSLPAETGLAELEVLAQAARQRALPDGDALRMAVAAVEAVIEGASWLHRPTPALQQRLAMPLRDYAISLLDGRHRRLRKRVKQVELTDQAAFHQLRIRVKKLRYPAELLKSFFDKDASADYLQNLVAMQDVLGALNDAANARVLLGELRASSTAHDLVIGWVAHQMEVARNRFPAVGRDFRHAAPFWED